MTTRDDLAWYENELRRARDDHHHDMKVLLRWRRESLEAAMEKTGRLFASEESRIEAAYEARVRWLESEIERLRTVTR